MKFVYNAPK